MKQAAEVLGISSEGVRQRIRRGTLESDKDADGRVYVWIDGEANGSERDTDGVIPRLENEVEWLRREVERKDALLMTLMHRVPELEAPSAQRDAPVTLSEPSEGPEHRPATGGAQEAAERSSWLRRWFGG